MRLSIIKKDLFNISNRLKSIDKNYFIVRNHLKKRFEIHYKREKNSLELILPFDKLDDRTIKLVLKTKIENRQKLDEEIEKNNAMLNKKAIKMARENLANNLG